MNSSQLLTKLYNNNNLEQVAEELYGHHTINKDDRYEHEGNHYRNSQFLVGNMYYTVSRENGVLKSISKG